MTLFNEITTMFLAGLLSVVFVGAPRTTKNEIDLTQEVTYPVAEKGKWSLLKPVPVELDLQFREMCRSFVEMSDADRNGLRLAIHATTQWTLREFAMRNSVFALREKDPELLNLSLTAMAMINGNRHDPRDIYVAMGRVLYASERLELDSTSVFEDAAEMADTKMATIITDLAQRPRDNFLEKPRSFREVVTDAGIGFVKCDNKKYEPENDMLDIAMRVAEAVEQDPLYESTRIEIAAKTPNHWMKHPENPNLEELISTSRGCVLVRAEMDRESHPDAKKQSFLLYTMEMESEEEAQMLLEMSRSTSPPHFSSFGISHGKIFSLIVSRSWVKGVDSIENNESLKRFQDSIAEQLR